MSIWNICNASIINPNQQKNQMMCKRQDVNHISNRKTMTPLELECSKINYTSETLPKKQVVKSRKSLKRQRYNRSTVDQSKKLMEQNQIKKVPMKKHFGIIQKKQAPINKVFNQNQYGNVIRYQIKNAYEGVQTKQRKQNSQKPNLNLRVTISYSNYKQSPRTCSSENIPKDKQLNTGFQIKNNLIFDLFKQVSAFNQQEKFSIYNIRNNQQPQNSKQPSIQNFKEIKNNLQSRNTLQFRHVQTIVESQISSETSEVLQTYKNLHLSHLVSKQSTLVSRQTPQPKNKKQNYIKNYRFGYDI